MMSQQKSVALGLALCAVALAICAGPATTQKTRASSYQQPQQQQQGYGGSQGAAYGGYNQARAASATPRGKPTQAYVNRPARPQQQQAYSQQQEQQPDGSAASSSYESSGDQQAEADAEPASYGSVGGQPGQDFPAYTQVPKTSFSCEGVPYEYGMYADEETGCQAYHLCYNGRKDSFLCGVGTVFNQRILHCDYWYSVDCAKSSQYYGSNAYMGSSVPEPAPVEAGERPPPQGQGSQSSYSRQQSPANSRPASYGNGNGNGGQANRAPAQSSAGSYSKSRNAPAPAQQPVQQQEAY